MPGFIKEYEIFYFQIDQQGDASPITILGFLEDCATSHSEAVGIGIDYLISQRTCWVLNRWKLQMNRYPHLGEKITVETYPSNFERFYGRREFNIRDSQGSLLGQASSLWIYLNIDKRRPTRIPSNVASQYGLSEMLEENEPFRDLVEITDVHSEISFHVRRSDIDTNGHVNNTRYAEWMLEGIAEDIMGEYRLYQLEVIYKKETKYGVDVLSQCQKTESVEPKYLHRIVDRSSGTELACGSTVWVKR